MTSARRLSDVLSKVDKCMCGADVFGGAVQVYARPRPENIYNFPNFLFSRLNKFTLLTFKRAFWFPSKAKMLCWFNDDDSKFFLSILIS